MLPACATKNEAAWTASSSVLRVIINRDPSQTPSISGTRIRLKIRAASTETEPRRSPANALWRWALWRWARRKRATVAA